MDDKIRANQRKAEMWNVFNEDTWIGWTYIILYTNKDKKNFAYVLYLAIDSNNRNKGYGTKALKLIFEKYKDYSISLAIETYEDEKAENLEQRIKRHNFYKRCGMEDLSYRVTTSNYTYDVMYYGQSIERNDYKDMMDNYTGWFFKYFNRVFFSDKPAMK